jgi:hypothetical protein
LFLNIIVITPSHHMGGATWLSGQRGALASWRSQVRIPVVAVN